MLTTDKTEKAFRDQIRRFLDHCQALGATPLLGAGLPTPPHDRPKVSSSASAPVPASDPAFRSKCLRELRKAQKENLLEAGFDTRLLAETVGRFARFNNPQAILNEERQLYRDLSAELRTLGLPNLAHFLELTDANQSLLVLAFDYHFQAEVTRRPKLKQFLDDCRWQRFSTQLDEGFAALTELFQEQSTTLRQTVDLLLQQQDKIDDLHVKMDEVLARVGMLNREVRPSDSMSIRTDKEAAVVRQLLAAYRDLPEQARQRLPDLLMDIGKLEVLVNDFSAAEQHFKQAAEQAQETGKKAAAHFNAYQAALQRGDFPAAFDDLMAAIRLDARQFAPFPVGKYHPLQILGAGGFGVAFLCKHKELDSKVVVKTLLPDQLDTNVDAIFAEAKALDELDHPAIIRLRECGYTEDGERPYLLMNYFEGETLEEFVQKQGPLSEDDVVAIGRQVAEGLQAAHDRGVLHRDVKPSNLIIRKDSKGWQVKIIDFGFAAHTAARRIMSDTFKRSSMSQDGKTIVGTLDFSAPEQLGRIKAKVGTWSDVYAFGRTLCFAFSCYSLVSCAGASGTRFA